MDLAFENDDVFYIKVDAERLVVTLVGHSTPLLSGLQACKTEAKSLGAVFMGFHLTALTFTHVSYSFERRQEEGRAKGTKGWGQRKWKYF